jgi:hypothetical protein
MIWQPHGKGRSVETKRNVLSAASILLLILVMSLVLFGCRPPVDLDRVPILPASGLRSRGV